MHIRRAWPNALACLLLASALLFALACGDAEGDAPEGPGPPVPVPEASAPRDVAVLEIEGMGEIRIELLADLAPLTVAHFVKLADEGFYDGTTFHRVAPGFMIQGGDPNTRDRDPRNDGLGGLRLTVADERSAVSHVRGIVSLANRGLPNSGSTQFFVVLDDARHLDGGYAVFGRVLSGMELADRIAAVERDVYGRHGPEDRPLEDVVVRRVRIERAEPAPVP
jgi:peptidyl-prolyl cis-trans isomerase B (cyclophilin B)